MTFNDYRRITLNSLPERTHIYQNHHIDSTHWDHFTPRHNDIVIATSLKSGTTWMQNILHNLLYLDTDTPPRLPEVTKWLDFRMSTLSEALTILEQAWPRRQIKTHLPLDGLRFFPQIKYIVVARDPRDVFMSLWNHYSNHTDHFYKIANHPDTLIGPPFPRAPQDIHLFWQDWITRGWFDWESEGYPYWGNMHHAQTWWNYRHLDNILFVHFQDLLTDASAEIKRIANYLSIPISDNQLAQTIEATSFNTLRNKAVQASASSDADPVWHGGDATFFFKGTNGRWRNILTPEELVQYDTKANQILSPDCRHWLEHQHK